MRLNERKRLSHSLARPLGVPLLSWGALSFALWGVAYASEHLSVRPNSLVPHWREESIQEWDPNFSFLNDFKFDQKKMKGGDPAWPEGPDWPDWIEPQKAAQIQAKYEQIRSNSELKQNHGLLGLEDAQNESDRIRDLRREALKEMRDHQRLKRTRQLKEAVERDEDLRKPVAIAVTAGALVTGTPIETSVGTDASVTVAANLPFQTTYIQLKSALGTSTVTAIGNLNAGNALTLAPPSWVSRDEHYTFSFSRELPIWNLGSGITYGGTSNTISASLSKKLTENLTCSLKSVSPIDSQASQLKASEESVRLDYKIHF